MAVHGSSLEEAVIPCHSCGEDSGVSGKSGPKHPHLSLFSPLVVAGVGVYQPQEAEEEKELQKFWHHHPAILQGKQQGRASRAGFELQGGTTADRVDRTWDLGPVRPEVKSCFCHILAL